MKHLRHLLSIYYGFISASITEATSFRVNFFLLILVDVVFYFISLTGMSMIFQHAQSIGPWDRHQMLFFVSYMLMVDCLHMGTVAESFWTLPFQIRAGDLDFILLRPAPAMFSIFFRHFRSSSFISLIIATTLLIYHGNNAGLNPLQWALTPFLILASTTLFILLEFFIATLTFWAQEGLGINFLRMQMQEVARYPDFIYQGWARRILMTLMPALLVGAPSLHFLLQTGPISLLVAQIFAIAIVAFGLKWLWIRALNHYESASS